MKHGSFIVLSCLLLPVTGYSEDTNNYPTLERVDHVLTCMTQHGGQNIDNLYACSCEIDAIAQLLSFDEYTEARTYEQYKRMPGEKGALFRESERADELTKKIKSVRDEADKRCFISKRAQVPEAASGKIH